MCLPGEDAGDIGGTPREALAPFHLDTDDNPVDRGMWDAHLISGGSDGMGFAVTPGHIGDPRLIHDDPGYGASPRPSPRTSAPEDRVPCSISRSRTSPASARPPRPGTYGTACPPSTLRPFPLRSSSTAGGTIRKHSPVTGGEMRCSLGHTRRTRTCSRWTVGGWRAASTPSTPPAIPALALTPPEARRMARQRGVRRGPSRRHHPRPAPLPRLMPLPVHASWNVSQTQIS